MQPVTRRVGPGDFHSGKTVGSPPVVSNARLAILMFLAAEAMFFAGLAGAFLVFRLSAESWPPPFQPRLPVLVTGINTGVLLLSGLTMRLAFRAVRGRRRSRVVPWLGTTVALGTLFLLIQGYEWVRLIQFGLTVKSGIYGATFYTLIGCHGLHVFGALVWLLLVSTSARKGRYAAGNETGIQICAMYWTFVVALWPFLYVLVYLL